MSKDKTDKKVEKKAAKADKKTGRKCGALVAFLALAAMLCGCASTGAQPSRSQTQNNELDNCIIVIAASATVSNATVVAESPDGFIPSEIFTQTMKNEGNETNQPKATPTNEVKTDVKATYGLQSDSASGASWIDSLESLSAQGLSAWLRGGKANGTMTVTKKNGTTETVTCKDGKCTNAAGDCITCRDGGGGCANGNCSE